SSCISGAEDYVVEVARSCSTVSIKCLVPPEWDAYDYPRMALDIYATPLGTLDGAVPDFYRVFTKNLKDPITGSIPYITFTDTFSDDALQAFSKDPTSVLKQNLLG